MARVEFLGLLLAVQDGKAAPGNSISPEEGASPHHYIKYGAKNR